MQESKGYGRMQILLHWAIAILIVANYFISDGMENAFDGMMKGAPVVFGWVPTFHVYAGVMVLILVALRLALRIVRPTAAANTGKPLLDKAAELGHYALYLLMIVAPALGALSWFGMIDVTASYHVLAVNVLLILALGHAAMSLFHQFVLRDGLMVRMIWSK
ncbi:MAG: cytochrome b561 [Rhodobacteraceae bacterium]|nr:MAG: cytochrome b561 [Paracoccaceae bacterium]